MGLPRGGTVALRGLHLLVLSAFGVAQPLFDLLGDTPEFFVVRGSTTADIVAFALAVVLVPPALLLAVETLVSALNARAGALLHLVFVAFLAGIVAVQALKRVDALPGTAVIVGALALGAVLAFLYARQAGIRSVLTVLSPAPLLFLALFLVNSPLDKLSLESDAVAGTPPEVASTTPVVLVVFDELAVTSLLDERGRVDAERLPAFGELAADSTFFPNATTVHEHTTESVPAILSGRNPRPDAVPLLADHPDNLFTWLGGTYSPHVLEPVTQLCPIDVCPRARESFGGRMASLGKDLGIVYLHVLLPEDKTGGLPSVTQTWQDFGDDHGEDEQGARPLALRGSADIDRAVGRELWRDQRFQFEQYVRGIERTQRPGLFFFHSMLTHSPWRFLPSGRVYSDSLGIEGIADDRWGDDEWLVAQGWQRHLLQVGFADRMFGRLLDRLRKEGIYDRALIVVTADHGLSFIPGERRRGVTPGNIHDVASVPLFVKRPGQSRPQVVERHVQTIDVVPTVADVLGTELPYEAHGESLFDAANDDATVTVGQRSGDEVTAAAADVARRKEETIRRLVGLFGSGRDTDLFSIGPHRELLGTPAAQLRPRPATDLQASVGGEALLAAADPESALSPAHLTGRLTGERAAAGLDLALAVNGRIAAVARSYETGGDVRFSAFAPERSFRAGANRVDVYAVNADGSLELLGGTREAAGYSLMRDGTAIATPHGAVGVAPALEGAVEDWYLEAETVRIGGWAGDVQSRRAATTVVAFDGEELVYSGTPGVGRADLATRYPGLGRSGFVAELPRARLEEDGVELRFFALRGNRATELPVPEGFPWKPAA
jgi:hypothetical protein